MRCLLGSNAIRRSQLTSKLFDFLDRAGWNGLDLDDNCPAGFVDQDAFDALPQGTELLLRQALIEGKLQAGDELQRIGHDGVTATVVASGIVVRCAVAGWPATSESRLRWASFP